LPGFYDLLRKAVECTKAGAIFCRHAIVNLNGHWIRVSELHRESTGLLDDWHAKITAEQLIQTPAIAVRRSVYEQLGGFLPNLHYVVDWEMWQRIASQFPVCFEPSILACYRLHGSSATSRLKLDAADVRDVRQMIELTTTYHTPARGRALARKARLWFAQIAVYNARDLLETIGFAPAWRMIFEALRLSCNRHIIRMVLSFLVLSFQIIGSRLRHWLKSKLRTSFASEASK